MRFTINAVTLVMFTMFTACNINNLFIVYFDPTTKYWVSYNWRNSRGIGWALSSDGDSDGDRGEPGDVNPVVIEYIFSSPEGPFARYYDLLLTLADRPRVAEIDLATLDAEARRGLRTGTSPRGCDYARALGRKLARPIRDALRMKPPNAGPRFEGTASVHWGIPVDLDAGIPLLEYERDGEAEMQTTVLRYQSVGLLVMRSSATRRLLVWDVSGVPGAFQWDAPLDQPTVAARIVALHPVEP
jgi:hypothetical protein